MNYDNGTNIATINETALDVQKNNLSVQNAITPEQLIRNAVTVFKCINQLKTLALSQTNINDWERIGNAPYLNAKGADKFIMAFGVQLIGAPTWTIEHESDVDGKKYTNYDCVVQGMLPTGAIAYGMGTSSTKDEFWSKNTKSNIEAGQGDYKEYDQIRHGFVKKKALTQAVADVVKKLIGLGNITWEDIENAGQNKEALLQSGVDFDSAEKPSKPKPKQKKNGKPVCPDCNTNTGVMVSKYENGFKYYCNPKSGGCGGKFNDSGNAGDKESNSPEMEFASKQQIAEFEKLSAVIPKDLDDKTKQELLDFIDFPDEKKTAKDTASWIQFLLKKGGN